MNSILEGKKAVVTGASWGIGRAIAIHLARQGCLVLATARREEMLKETLESIQQTRSKGRYFVADLSRVEDIKSLASYVKEEMGGLDYLIHGAFGELEDSLEESSDEELAEFIQTSVTGTMLLTKYLLPLFPANKGQIVNIVADWGLPMHNILTEPMTPYITAKHAISGFSHTLRRELGLLAKPNLKVTAIYPGATAAIDYETETSFSIDDPIEKSGDLISLKDLAHSVEFVLNQEHSTVTHLVLSPPNNLYNGLAE